MGTQTQPIQSSTDGQTQFSEGVKQSWTFYDVAGNLVVQLGKQPDGSYGGRFARAGKSLTSGDPADVAFSTADDVLKVITKGFVTVTRAASSNSGSAILGVPPNGAAFLGYMYRPNTSPAFRFQLPISGFDPSGSYSSGYRMLYDPSVGAVKCLIDNGTSCANYATAETVVFQYFILSETLA